MSESGGWRQGIRRAMRPLRPIYSGMALLLALYLVSMGIGLYNAAALPHPGDRSLLVMLATMVWPGIYFFYMVFCFFLFHARKSIVLTLTFNITVLMMALALAGSIALNLRGEPELPLRLHEAMFHNFLAAAAIGALSAALLWLFAPGGRRQDSSL